MPTKTNPPRVREGGPKDLDAIYALASSVLTYDRFSRDLLAEKLFCNPDSRRYRYDVVVAERGANTVGFMQSVERPEDRKAWVGMFVVHADHRRQGVAAHLLDQLRTRWREQSIREVEALAIPGNYFMPGLDPRYTEAHCFLERQGFERFRDCVNLIGHLSRVFETAAEEKRLGGEGVEIRRARAEDEPLLKAYFAEHFGPDWRLEAQLAMRNDPPGLHLALRGGQLIAFSAHSTQNREWGFFGPMGTAPEARGLGLGNVLLRRCLNDLREAGHETAVIPWVGPISFYSHYTACRVDRVFWRYRFNLQDS